MSGHAMDSRYSRHGQGLGTHVAMAARLLACLLVLLVVLPRDRTLTGPRLTRAGQLPKYHVHTSTYLFGATMEQNGMGWDGMGERKKPESAWGQGVIDACRTGQTQALALAACACTCPCRLRQVLCPTTAVDMIRQIVSFSNAPTGGLRLAWLSGVPVHLGRTRYYCTAVIKTTSMYM